MSVVESALRTEVDGKSYSTPSMDELELASSIRNLFYKARAQRRPLVAQWTKNYRILRNRTWMPGRAPWIPAPEVPEIYPIIAAQVGWMTDQRPSFEVVPASEPHSDYHEFYSTLAHDLEVTMQAAWQVNEYEAEIEQCLWDGFIYGTGILKSGWDTALVGGMGDAVMRRVDPYTFYPDPAATSMRDANYFIEARTMSVQEMDRRWPGSAKKVGGGGATEDIDAAPTNSDTGNGMPRANPGAIPPSATASFGRVGGGRISATDEPGITVFEAWLREHRVVDFDGVEGVDDSWRVVVVAGNCILLDESASELWAHGQHPYERYVPHRNGEFWGMSMVEMLAPSQLAINRLLAALQLNVELVGNPVFKESTRAGISRTKLTNKPGTRLPINEGGTAEWLNPPQIHPMMAELVQFYIGEMERISGLSAITRGMAPGGRVAQGVVDTMQESSFVRIRTALRNLEWTLRAVGDKVAALITENYTTPRMVAIVGPSAEKSSMALKGKHFYVPSEEGRVPMRFQLLVQAGSSLPTSRNARISEADTLYAMGALDDEALLEAHDYPNRRQITLRVGKAKADGSLQPPGARQRTQRTA